MPRERRRYRRLAERIALYNEARRLRAAGWSLRRIGALLDVGSNQTYYWLVKNIPPHYERYVPDLSPSADLAYLTGFWLGDGRSAGKEKKVRFKLADRAQLEVVNGAIAGLLGREKKIRTEGQFYTVGYDSALLYDFVSQPIARRSPMI